MITTRLLQRVGLVLLAALVLAQLYRPARVSEPYDPSKIAASPVRLTPEVGAILQRSCWDCHSNWTRWPWYSGVAPTSWMVANDVAEGRSHLNLSELQTYDQQHLERKLQQICEEVTERGMPLSSYLFIHRDARLSDEDIQAICRWAQEESKRLGSETPPAR